VARTTARLEEGTGLGHEALQEMARENRVHAIHLVSGNGELQASSMPPDHFSNRNPPDFREEFPALFSGAEQESVLGVHLSSADGAARYAVAVRRKHGGIVVCSIDARTLLDLRKTFGLGRLIQDAGNVHGIRYAMIQDQDGILAATPNISGARKILDDPFLAALWEQGGESTRRTTFKGEDVFEVARKMPAEGGPGILRVAFDLSGVKALEREARRRLWMTALVLAVLGIVALNAAFIHQNMKLAVRARDEVSTFSGAVLSGMADSVLVFSDPGKAALTNEAARALFGPHLDRVPRALEPLVEDARRKNAPVTSRLEVPDEDGRPRVLAASASRVRVPGEEAPYTVLILKDVTEEQRLRESIQRSEKATAMGRLAAAVAHEVRNPLNAIAVTAQRLRAEFEPREETEEYRRFLDVIASEIGRLDGIITRFLRFAREPRIEPGAEDVGRLVSSVFTQVAGQAAEHGARLVSQVPAGWTAVMDGRQMRQVLLNLVTNAIDAVEGTGEVRISAERQGGWVQIAVDDDGPGMTREEIERAFEFHVTTKEKGTGLGLPISQRIVERHGGVLDMESRKGAGTRVTIRFPQGDLKG
jgi:signal transduction histidine kinase